MEAALRESMEQVRRTEDLLRSHGNSRSRAENFPEKESQTLARYRANIHHSGVFGVIFSPLLYCAGGSVPLLLSIEHFYKEASCWQQISVKEF